MLDKLVRKFIDVCACTRPEAEQKGLLKVYGEFPANSLFRIPKHIEGEVAWGTIQRIGGQKPRLAGYIIENLYSILFSWTKIISSSLRRRNIHK